MESIDKLRELVCDINCNEIDAHLYNGITGQFISEGFIDSWRAAAEKAIAAIEAEIAERYMELPVDADGVPIHQYDKVEIDGLPTPVDVIEIAPIYTYCGAAVGCPLEHVRHVKPRTVEDVLADFAAEVENGHNDIETARRYADELRELRQQ